MTQTNINIINGGLHKCVHIVQGLIVRDAKNIVCFEKDAMFQPLKCRAASPGLSLLSLEDCDMTERNFSMEQKQMSKQLFNFSITHTHLTQSWGHLLCETGQHGSELLGL